MMSQENLSILTMDKAIELVVTELKDNTDWHYLHKPHEVHTPDSCLSFVVPESIFTTSDHDRFNQIARQFLNAQCLCYGMHNGRAVFKIKDYFVAAPPMEWAKKFNVEKTNSKGVKKIEELNATRQDKLTTIIAAYGGYVSAQIKFALGEMKDDLEPKYYFFDAANCDNIENNGIYSQIKHYYNDELHAKDIRTDSPLADSFFIMLGWLFGPKEKSLRMAGCFECSTSGIGKTSFIKELCSRTEVVHGKMSQSNGTANSFSFSPCFAKGPDIVTVDDPCQGTSDILQKISGVVSNSTTEVELKTKDRYDLDDVYSRFYISTNVPLYMRSDSNNFLTKKIFVLKANDIGDNKEHIASNIARYISYCDQREINEFLTYCVSLYNTKGKQFITDHLGLYIDTESTNNLFADMLNALTVKDLTTRTLIECVLKGRSETDREWNDELLKNWNKLTKFIKDNYSEIAVKNVCGVPTNNRVYIPGRRPGKDRFKNFILTDELRAIILKHIQDGYGFQSKEDEASSYHDGYDDTF